MNDHPVTVIALAKRLGVAPSSARRIALAYGFTPDRRQVKGVGRYRRVLVWTDADAAEIIDRRRRDGFLVQETST